MRDSNFLTVIDQWFIWSLFIVWFEISLLVLDVAPDDQDDDGEDNTAKNDDRHPIEGCFTQFRSAAFPVNRTPVRAMLAVILVVSTVAVGNVDIALVEQAFVDWIHETSFGVDAFLLILLP